MFQQSIRTRLTLWYAAALALIILLFSIGIYIFVRSNMLREADRELVKDYKALKTVVLDEPEDIEDIEEIHPTACFKVVSNGGPMYISESWVKKEMDECLEGEPELDEPYSWTQDGEALYRVIVNDVESRGSRYRIAMAKEVDEVHEALLNLSIILVGGFPCALLLALLGGYSLAGKALAPVDQMARKAGEITARNLSERLPVKNPEDEFGRLATVFNETLARLESSFENLRRFTSDASHELRTPLTAIRSVGEVGLQEASGPDEYRDVIGSMLEEADRLAILVDSLLTLTRAESGRLELSKKEESLSEIVEEAVEHLRVLADEKDQVLECDLQDKVQVTVDRGTFRQALLNLLDNAVKYTPAGGTIWVTTKALNGEAIVEIVDDGPGIAPEHQTRIFDRFYRIDKGRSRDMGGTGLGLSIARWEVEINGGRIELESEVGTGSTFRVILPVNTSRQVAPPL